MGGDDSLIKRQKGIIYVLTFVLIILVFAFGLVQLVPHSNADQKCTYTIHPLLVDRFIRLNWPELPRKCNG